LNPPLPFPHQISAKIARGMGRKRLGFIPLSKDEKTQITAAHSAVLRKLTDLAFDESAAVRLQESHGIEADNADVLPVTETVLQNDLFESSGNPL
jgi:hypothetical protein